MRLQSLLSLFFLFVFVFVTVSDGFSQGLHDRIVKRNQAAEASAKAQAPTETVSFTVDRSYQGTFDLVVNQLKKEGFTIEEADTVKGQISTPIEVSKGGYSQKGKRVLVILIKEDDRQTTLKVAVTEFSRKKLFATEPWEKPKPDNQTTKELAGLLETALNGATASSPN